MSNDSSWEDQFTAEEPRPLIPEGKYQMQCVGLEKGNSHRHALKLFLHFKIIDPGEYEGKMLFMAINLLDSQTGKPFKRVPPGSKYWQSWVIANNGQLPSRGDRMSPRIFQNAIFEVQVRTVKPLFQDKTEKPECFHYSVIDHLIRRCA